MNWNNYYLAQAGYGDYDVFRGSIYQKGHGLGGNFRKFFNWIVPLFQKYAMPSIKKGATAIGQTAIDSLTNMAKDAIKGKKIKETSKENLETAINTLKTRAENHLQGKGRKRKKKILFRKKDIFSE